MSPRGHVSTCPGVVWSQTRRCRRLAASWRCCPIPSLCIITDMLSDNARCCCTLLHKNSSPTGAHPASSWEVPVTPQPLSSLLTPQPSPAHTAQPSPAQHCSALINLISHFLSPCLPWSPLCPLLRCPRANSNVSECPGWLWADAACNYAD